MGKCYARACYWFYLLLSLSVLEYMKVVVTGIMLGQSWLQWWNITPLLDHWLPHLPGVGSGSGADLLGYINTLLSRFQLRNKLGHVTTCSLRLQWTFLLGSILNNGLLFVIALLSSLLESTTCWSTQLSWFLRTRSVVLCQPIRDQCIIVSTNQRSV